MEKFFEMMEKLGKMGEAERNRVMADARASCTCPACPTYNDCMRGKGEALYCAVGRTACTPPEKKACLCPTCPVTPMMGLKNSYYCVRGAEKDLRKG